MAPKQLKRFAQELRFLAKSQPKERTIFLRDADDELITCLCECAKNILNGNVPISNSRKRKLARYKTHLRSIADKNIPHVKRKRILTQQGGFISVLLKPIIQALGGLLVGAMTGR